jgi:hypothetical protein
LLTQLGNRPVFVGRAFLLAERIPPPAVVASVDESFSAAIQKAPPSGTPAERTFRYAREWNLPARSPSPVFDHAERIIAGIPSGIPEE